ncbi:MAG: YebC/PmpR family DNA-binding transcriptional regulator [Patescibacteria group bacterium]
MSGHSHWSQVKHKKAITDVKKGQLRSKLMNGIYIALREGNNPETNGKLRTAIERAKDFGIGQDTVERALAKPEKTDIEEAIYEIYGPNGTAFLIKAQTDSKNRTTGEIKHLISNFGKLAEPGAVIWMFEEKGIVEVLKDSADDSLIVQLSNFGLEDYKETTGDDGEKIIMLICEPKNVFELKKAVDDAGVKVELYEVQFLPKTLVNLGDTERANLDKFIDKILEHPDVSSVFVNTD